jgi:transposase-like protein
MARVVIPTQYRLRVKQRLAAVTDAEELGVKPAARHFGLDRRTIRTWRNRWRQGARSERVFR